MQVLKFGGTSVATAKNIRLVREIVAEKVADGPVVVVVSAMGGITSQLIECGILASAGDEAYLGILKEIGQRHMSTVRELIGPKSQGKTLSQMTLLLNELEDIFRGIYLIRELSAKTNDRISGFGEMLSSLLINDFFQEQGIESNWADPRQMLITDDRFGKATVNTDVSYRKIRKQLKGSAGAVVIPGFISATEKGEYTTLGRGGSDYSAALFAAALKTKVLEIWTDVSGMMTADPRLVSSAYVIKEISYEEAMELSHFGAKVIYPPSILPALQKKIPILIKNTFQKLDAGTLITEKPATPANRIIRGLSSIPHIALINLTGSGMVGIPNFSHRFFRALAQAQINVIMITQASSEHSICVGIAETDVTLAKAAVEWEFDDEIEAHRVDKLEIESDLAIIALVGSNMKHQVGVSGKMFSTLGQNGVNIKAIAQGSSEKNISVVLQADEVKKAINSLHESFFLSDRKKLNLFIIGVGNVGSALLGQLQKQRTYLLRNHHIDLCVAALANSKKMLFKESGISLKTWKEDLLASEDKMELSKFMAKMDALNLRNSIFIDNTDNASIASSYLQVLETSTSVVTPNKIACTQSFANYLELKEAALKYKAKMFYETNVGAGLPVINTLNDLIKSGDEINKIEAVLSGSLNFIFNNYDGTVPFADIVRRAGEEGYTEPDPRIDLSGIDVKRKILILIRECGISMETDDIQTQPFIPQRCFKAKSVDAFLKSLEDEEEHFQKMSRAASSKGQKIKYVASYNKGKASTGLQQIGSDHPFYHLEGKDNIVAFTTRRYPEQPLVIKGAGAGAEVTASGIFADIMRIANS